MSRSMWTVLGLSATTDQTEIRRAYARELKKTNPEDDPEGFQALREAYDAAMAQARRRAASQEQVAVAEPAEPREAVRTSVSLASGGAATNETVFEQHDRLAREMEAVQAERNAEFLVLDEACKHLRETLTGETAPDPQDVERQGKALLALPAMDDLGVFAQVDHWLSDLVARTIPRSDPLVEMGDARFGWSASVKETEPSPAVEHLLTRLDDLAYLRVIGWKGHAYFKAFELLRAPPCPEVISWRGRAIWQAGAVQALLQEIERAHRTVFADLDPSSLDWWRAYLAQPQIGKATISLGLFATAIGGFVGLVMNGLLGVVAGTALTGGVFSALLALLHFGLARPRHRWVTGWKDTAPDWVKLGWAPVSLAVVLLAGLIPYGQPVLIGVIILALVPLGWASVVADPGESRHHRGDTINAMIWSNLYIAAALGLMALMPPSMSAFQAGLAAVIAGMTFARAREPLLRYWRSFGKPRQLRAMFGLMGLAAASLGWGALARGEWMHGVLVALTGIVCLLQRPALQGLGGLWEDRLRLRIGMYTMAGLCAVMLAMLALKDPIPALLPGGAVLLSTIAVLLTVRKVTLQPKP